MHIPDYIEHRIRRSIPTGAFVIPGSTPVVSFGDAINAKAATLGLNPSRVEFLDRSGNELAGPLRRLATHRSLGVDDLSSAPRNKIEEVLSDCNSYFERNPYKQWFDQLEQILEPSGLSYYNGTACHLDLVQWATDPTWRSLKPKSVREELIDADSIFLKEQLSRENIRLILLNGSAVISQLKRRFNTHLNEVAPITGIGHTNTRIYEGLIFGGVQVVAWSTNLQSSFGVSSRLRSELASRVSMLINRNYAQSGPRE